MPQRAADEIVTRDPFNAQTPAAALDAPLTPVGDHYVRNHFPVPRLDARHWRLRLTGALTHPREITYAELLAMPPHKLDVVMECAGNGRTRMAPKPPGTPWGERAVACARYKGVALADLLAAAGIEPGAQEILFVGADHGVAHGHELAYERSLPLERALHPDTLVAYEMNGQPLTPEHGAPVRLVVPGWYGVASVKWLVEARAIREPFQGFYQADHYVYKEPRGMDAGPVTTMRVKSLFSAPLPGARLHAGAPVEVRGKAWSGDAPIAGVECSDDGGRTWHAATLAPSAGPYAWVAWRWTWTPRAPGTRRLLARAVDAAGHVQPMEAPWNALGYGNNEAARVDVDVV